MRIYLSKLSSNSRASVPDDTIRNRVSDPSVLIEKSLTDARSHPFAVFTEWASVEDDLAFADL